MENEYDVLKKKIDLGATKAITQFFFDSRYYIEFIEGAIKRGIKIPIVPGILPVTNCQKTIEFAKKMNWKQCFSFVFNAKFNDYH